MTALRSSPLEDQGGRGGERPARKTAAQPAARQRTQAAGFTLPELLVAMVAGLMVALAVVGLSKEANSTFQEETRVAGAEMQLRSAVDRLRSDLQRASFMSTANILADPTVAHTAGGSNVANVPVGAPAIKALQGILLTNGGSINDPLSAVNGLNPDLVQLTGSFTTTEQLVITAIGTSGSSACGGQRLYLDVNSSPSLWRLVGMTASGLATNYDAAMKLAFQPATNPNGVGAPTGQFIVRVGDDTGHYQYLVPCAATPAAWNLGAPYVDLDPSTPVMTNAQLGGGSSGIGGVSGNCAGRCTVNPIQIVRWWIAPTVLGNGDATKYDLMRQYVDVKGVLVGSPEVIAEYAVDLKVAFAVDTNNNGDVTGGSSTQAVYPFDDGTGTAQNELYAKDVSSPAGKVQFPGPQRIRSVRFRLATRAQAPDRSQALAATSGYVFRYCTIATGCTAGANGWARARTVLGEISLPNQARLFWP